MLLAQASRAQPAEDEAYLKVITQRADKIVAPMGISDSANYYKVRGIIVQQYRSINSLDEKYKGLVVVAQAEHAAGEGRDNALKQIDAAKKEAQQKQHDAYIASLDKCLTAKQIDHVKDGMTYGLLDVTYNAYTDMIPSLKEDERKQIRDWLLEARELAMDGASSDAKHGVFGKYKGRINNYLSARGYDLTKERDAWMKRVKEKKG